MALQLGPVPNFQTNIPQYDPLQTYSKMLQLRALQGQLQFQQQSQPLQLQQQEQTVQAATLQNEKTQQELASQKALQAAITGGLFNKYAGVDTQDGSGFDANGAYQDLVRQGVLPQQAGEQVNSLLTIAKNNAEIQKTLAQGGEAQQNIRAKTLTALADKLGSINDMTIADAGPALDALKQDLLKNPGAYQGLTQLERAHLYAADLGHLPAAESLLGLEAKIADFHKSKSDAAKAAQGVIPAGGGMSPDTQQQVQKDIAVATNPQIQAGKEAVSAAEGRARANVEAQMARGSNAALANVPPHLIQPAAAAATKAGEDYAAAQAVTQRMNATMDAARQGNVISYQIIPEEGTLQITTSQGVHRINQAEIQQYAGGGSLWQRMQGHFGKALTGESIPKSVLDDMAQIQKIQAEGARAKYENSLQTINQNYGSTFKPLDFGGSSVGSQRQNIQPGFTRIQASDGSTHDIPTANLGKAKQRDPNLQVLQ